MGGVDIKRGRGGVQLPPHDYDNRDMDKKSCHVWYKCDGRSCEDRGGCMFCDGGLGACTVCGGIEGSLTTECPGIELPQETLDLLYALKIDFNQGRWWMSHDEMNADGWPERYAKDGHVGSVQQEERPVGV